MTTILLLCIAALEAIAIVALVRANRKHVSIATAYHGAVDDLEEAVETIRREYRELRRKIEHQEPS